MVEFNDRRPEHQFDPNMAAEAVRRHYARDRELPIENVQIHSVKENPHHIPGYPASMQQHMESKGLDYHDTRQRLNEMRTFNHDAHVSHLVRLRYTDPTSTRAAPKDGWEALYGVGPEPEHMALWAD